MRKYFALRIDLSISPLGEFETFLAASEEAQRTYPDTFIEVLDASDLQVLQNAVALAIHEVSHEPGQDLSFNTGRMYCQHGQRIAAAGLADGRFVFVDVDRGITGVSLTPCKLTRYNVLDAYDAGLYSEAIVTNHLITGDLVRRLRAAALKVHSVQEVTYAG